MGMRNVPEWARVDKSEYRRLREELRRTADASSFSFISVWNLMIEDMEDRYSLHLEGRHKMLPTLEWAVTTMQKEMVDERARLMEETQPDPNPMPDPAQTEEYVREMARRDAERVKALGR